MSPPSRASLASSADIRKVCSLWIHNSSFSKQEVLFNAALLPRGSATNGLLLKILPHHPHASPSLQTHVPPLSRPSHAPSFADSSSDSTAFVFVAHDLSNDQRSKHPNLQISVSEAIASCHGFYSRMSVLLVAADREDHAASHVELHFKDPLNRDDLWKMIVSDLHQKQCLYQGQKLKYLGSIEFTVRKIYVKGQKAASAVFTDQSKPIFRSLAARYVLGVQLSAEMWEFDQYPTCELRWVRLKTFLMELFDRWDALGAKHSVTLFFFTRLHYPGSTHPTPPTEDFYRVVASELSSAGCKSLHDRLDEEFRCFLKDIERRAPSSNSDVPLIAGVPVPARVGNFLEAVNLAASASLHDDIDLDFVRTGTLVLVLTPGPAIFDVQESLLRMTSARLIMRQIGVELVSMSLPPLHVAPLFAFSAPANGEKDSSNADTSKTYVIPSWVETSFYEGPKKKPANAKKYLSFANEHEENGFQCSQQVPIPDAVILGTGVTRQPPSPDKDQMSQAFQSKGREAFVEMTKKIDRDSFCHDGTTTGLQQSRRDFRSSSQSISKPFQTEAACEISTQLVQTSTPPFSRMARPRPALSLGSRSQGVHIPATASEMRRTSREVRLLPFKASTLYGKASATTSSTSESAQSKSTRVRNASIAREDPESMASQFRASLQRRSSSTSRSLRSLESSSGSKHQESIEIQASALVAAPNSQVEASPIRANSFRDSEDQSANFFGAASSYSKRKKMNIGDRPSASLGQSQDQNGDMPWFVVESPLKPHKTVRRAFGEWNHVSTRETQAYALKWKALCTPASLPLTTEDFPSWSQLRAGFTESPYRVAVTEDHTQDTILTNKRANLARELIQARISDGFQIAVGRKARDITGAEDLDLYAADLMGQEGSAVLLVRGDDLQLLSVHASEAAVTRFQRRIQVPPAISYQANIRTAFEQSYRTCDLVFGLSTERNWNNIDTQIASHELDEEENAFRGSEALARRRARFVLIPVSLNSTSNATGGANDDSDEETRIDGIYKLTKLWQKNRWHPPSRQRHKASWTTHDDRNPLSIEFHTRDPSAVVAAGLESLNDGENTAVSTRLFNSLEPYHTSNVDLQDLAAELQSERGVRVKTRRWHLQRYEYCFIGADLATFFMARFQDIKKREDAVEFGNLLLKKRLFHHVTGKHAFRDGQYFYSISDEYRVNRPEVRSSGWFGTRKPPTPAIVAVDRAKESPDLGSGIRQAGSKQSKVCLNASLQYNLDPRKTSMRTEVITIHYDRLHNPENAFHFEIEWQNATARLVEDALTSWATTIAKLGLKLIQLPVAESARITDINPLRTPYVVELALRPPTAVPSGVTDSPAILPQQLRGALPFQKAILRRLDFVLDFEAKANFPANVNVTYTWGTAQYQYSQYIHRSGMLLAQIIDDTKFILLANRFYNNRAVRGRDQIFKDKTPEKTDRERRGQNAAISRSTSALFNHSSPLSSPVMRPALDTRHSPVLGGLNKQVMSAEGLKDRFDSFCHDASALRSLYDQVFQQLSSLPGKSTPALSAVSTGQTPVLLASIPSLDIAEEAEESLTLPPRH